MADCYGTTISSTFIVNKESWDGDEKVNGMKALVRQNHGHFEESPIEGRPLDVSVNFGFEGRYPSLYIDVGVDVGVDVDADVDAGEMTSYGDIISSHLVSGEVAKVTISGAEKLRYNECASMYIFNPQDYQKKLDRFGSKGDDENPWLLFDMGCSYEGTEEVRNQLSYMLVILNNRGF